MKDQLVHPEEDETVSHEGSSEELINDNINSEDNDEESGTTSTTTMSDSRNDESNPSTEAHIQQAIQVALATFQAAQTAFANSTGDKHQSVHGLKDAPRFNGKGDVRMWIRRYEAYANAMGWTDAEQLNTLTVALEEAANDWLWSQERRDPEEEETADKLARRKAGLIRRFGQTLINDADYSQLYALKQGNKETVDELMERLDAVERRLPEPAPENVKKFAFISALRPQLRLKVEEQRVKTMDEATDIARGQEEILLRIYGPRKDATDMADSQTNLPRTIRYHRGKHRHYPEPHSPRIKDRHSHGIMDRPTDPHIPDPPTATSGRRTSTLPNGRRPTQTASTTTQSRQERK